MKFFEKDIYLINLSTCNQGKIISNLKINFKESKIHKIELSNFRDTVIPDGSIVLIPGVGSFERSSKALKSSSEKLLSIINNSKIFKICICLGFQILFNSSDEGDNPSQGLSLYRGNVISFEKNNAQYITNTGYLKIFKENNQELSTTNYFFNHRFYVDISTLDKRDNIKYFYSFNGEKKFLSMLFDSNLSLLGMQFHPEMSGRNVFKDLLYNLEII